MTASAGSPLSRVDCPCCDVCVLLALECTQVHPFYPCLGHSCPTAQLPLPVVAAVGAAEDRVLPVPDPFPCTQAQNRFYDMMAAWKEGRIEDIGTIFRQVPPPLLLPRFLCPYQPMHGFHGATARSRRHLPTPALHETHHSHGPMLPQDGIGLRDEYKISGPELESMCDIVRTVPGVPFHPPAVFYAAMLLSRLVLLS